MGAPCSTTFGCTCAAASSTTGSVGTPARFGLTSDRPQSLGQPRGLLSEVSLVSPKGEAGTVGIFVWYDEDRPVPNLTIAPTSHKGKITSVTGSHAALLKTMESMLGLSVMNQGQLPSAPNLRRSLGI